MIAKSRIMYSTQRYEFAYGKRPRGFGTWIFLCKKSGASQEFEHIGNYGEAKARAIEYCAQKGYFICSLQS